MYALKQHVVPAVVLQHLEDAVALRAARTVLVRSPQVQLLHLGRADERLAAHLDGLSVSGDYGVRLSQSAPETSGVGELFVATVLAVERRDEGWIQQLSTTLEAVPAAAHGLSSAFGWASASLLRGLLPPMLSGASPSQRWLGIAACAQHRVNPGAALRAAMDQSHASNRAGALRAAGALGCVDLLPVCVSHLRDEHLICKLAAARSGVLLGGRGEAANTLRDLALEPGPAQSKTLPLALFAADLNEARALVKQLAAQGAHPRTTIKAAGWAGDPQVTPWLLAHMEDAHHARLAGEAFSFLTGVDLAVLNLDRSPPEQISPAVNDDPNDESVEMDEDDGLPWPDPEKIGAWWQTNGHRFTPGARYFMGEPPSPVHCLKVLKAGSQRQRIAAAEYLCLLNPGTPLFNTAAPAWRQRRMLAQMGA